MEKFKITYDTKKNSRRARATVQLIDATTERFEACGTSDEAAREKLLEKVNSRNAEIQYGIEKEAGNITLADAVLELIKERREAYDYERDRPLIRPETSQREEEGFRVLILPHPVAKKKLNRIFVADCESYRRWLSCAKYDKCRTSKPHEPVYEHYDATYLNRIMALVRQVINNYYAHTDMKSPAEVLKNFKVINKPKTEADFLIDDEVRIFLDYCAEKRKAHKHELDATHADYFTLILLCGMRPGEAAALQARDYDPGKGCLNIMRTGEYEDGRTKTVLSMSSVYLLPPAREIIERRIVGLDPTDRLFSNTRGDLLNLDNARKRFKTWLKELEIDKGISTKALRGSCGTFLFDNGCSAEEVMLMLRHSSPKTTLNYYISRNDKRKKEMIDNMAAKLDRNGSLT